MRRAALVMLASLAGLAAPALAASPADTVAAFHAALGAGKTTEALALLDPGVQIYEAGHVERSRDEYAAHHLGADAAFAAATTTRVLRQSARITQDAALVLRETETVGRFKGTPVHSFGTETVALEKTGDGWRITHIHWSLRKGTK